MFQKLKNFSKQNWTNLTIFSTNVYTLKEIFKQNLFDLNYYYYFKQTQDCDKFRDIKFKTVIEYKTIEQVYYHSKNINLREYIKIYIFERNL